MKRTLTALALVTLMTGPVMADILFEAVLSGSEAVPPNDSQAGGVASLILNEAETEAAYTVNFSGLEGGEQILGHFHQAPAGEDGPVVLDIGLGTPLSGVWMIGPDEVAALLDEEIYVNIHSEAYPGGEIRGQFMQISVPNDSRTWSQIKGLYR